jgi:hypothetical protein
MKRALSSAIATLVLGVLGNIPSAEALFLFPKPPSTFDNGAMVICGVYQGANCEIPLYEFGMCEYDSRNPQTCIKACQDEKPVCAVQDFALAVRHQNAWGRIPAHGELVNHAEDFDENGNLLFVAEKTLSVCFTHASEKNRRYLVGQARTCPKAKVASEESCKGGTHFNPDTQRCEIRDPSCGAGGSAYATGVIRQTQGFLAVQNSHFSEGVIGKDTKMAATAGDVAPEGFIQMTRAPMVDLSGAEDAMNALAKSTGKFVSGGAGSAAATASASGSAGAGVASEDGATSGDLVYGKKPLGGARGTTEAGLYGSDTYVGTGGGGVGAAGGGSSGSGGGWFGSSLGAGSTPGEGATASAEFGSSEGNRVPAAAGAVDDPADYFMRSDISISLFKRVTSQFRKKERDLVLSQ